MKQPKILNNDLSKCHICEGDFAHEDLTAAFKNDEGAYVIHGDLDLGCAQKLAKTLGEPNVVGLFLKPGHQLTHHGMIKIMAIRQAVDELTGKVASLDFVNKIPKSQLPEYQIPAVAQKTNKKVPTYH